MELQNIIGRAPVFFVKIIRHFFDEEMKTPIYPITKTFHPITKTFHSTTNTFHPHTKQNGIPEAENIKNT